MLRCLMLVLASTLLAAPTFAAPCGPQDSDGDGIPDAFEDLDDSGADCDDDDADGDGVANYLDSDDDGDGILTLVEGTSDSDGDFLPDYLDEDSDDDRVPDFVEAQDEDADGIADRMPTGSDTDGDGLDDRFDPDSNGALMPLSHHDDDGIPSFRDPDDDGDGVLTRDEDEDGDGDPRNDDADADGTPDYLDPDPVTAVESSPPTRGLWLENRGDGVVRIRYRASAHPTHLRAYDMRGRLVATLEDDRTNSDVGRLDWNVSSLPAGIYFVRLVSTEGSFVAKLLKLR